MIRYLVRRATGQVYIWTELASREKDLEEVHAENPAEALIKRSIPGTESITVDQIEAMGKEDLIIFGRVRLGIVLDETLTKADMQDAVKEKLMMRPTERAMQAAIATGPFASPTDVRSRSGMTSEIPKRTAGPTGGVANAGDSPDRPLRP